MLKRVNYKLCKKSSVGSVSQYILGRLTFDIMLVRYRNVELRRLRGRFCQATIAWCGLPVSAGRYLTPYLTRQRPVSNRVAADLSSPSFSWWSQGTGRDDRSSATQKTCQRQESSAREVAGI